MVVGDVTVMDIVCIDSCYFFFCFSPWVLWIHKNERIIMPYLNQVTIMGHLTKDPEVKYTSTGTAMCTFTVGINEKGRDGGKDRAHFIPVILWGKSVEWTAPKLKKGVGVVVNGKLDQSAWKDKDGNHRSAVKVSAFTVVPLAGKGDSVEASGVDDAPEPSLDDDVPF
jgi:single-strand DNA-binding protein